jgi:hypothetical protein
MNFLRTFFIILFFTIAAPFFGTFAATEKGETASWTSSVRTISEDRDIVSTGWISETEAKKEEKKSKISVESKEENQDMPDTVSASGNTSDKEKVQQEINTYILEAYKIQWNKILKDIDSSLQKINPDAETRIQAYYNIQKTLEMRKKRVRAMTLSDNNKDILNDYLEYMIQALKKRQAELKE